MPAAGRLFSLVIESGPSGGPAIGRSRQYLQEGVRFVSEPPDSSPDS